MKPEHIFFKAASSLLIVATLLACTACGKENEATTMNLIKTEGTVDVDDAKGKSLKLIENMGLYSGYGVGTQTESYAWINLDDAKLTKLDQNSKAVIEKDGNSLVIDVQSGSMFFNITEALGEDESMNIRTSTMVVGIRGTSGWVIGNEEISSIALLSGSVDATFGKNKEVVSVEPMEQLVVKTDGDDVFYEILPVTEVPDFVNSELSDEPVTVDDVMKVMKEYAITDDWIETNDDNIGIESIVGKNSLTAFVPIGSYDEADTNKIAASMDFPHLNISTLGLTVKAGIQRLPDVNYDEIGNYWIRTLNRTDVLDVIWHEVYITKAGVIPDNGNYAPAISIYFTAKIKDPENGREISRDVIDEVFNKELEKIMSQLE